MNWFDETTLTHADNVSNLTVEKLEEMFNMLSYKLKHSYFIVRVGSKIDAIPINDEVGKIFFEGISVGGTEKMVDSGVSDV